MNELANDDMSAGVVAEVRNAGDAGHARCPGDLRFGNSVLLRRRLAHWTSTAAGVSLIVVPDLEGEPEPRERLHYIGHLHASGTRLGHRNADASRYILDVCVEESSESDEEAVHAHRRGLQPVGECCGHSGICNGYVV